MVLKKLNEDQLEQLYRLELTAVFPPDELKPLKAMLALMAGGRYEALGLYEEEALRGYALLWLEPDIPFALLDYLGTMRGRRGQGVGSAMLDLLAGHYQNLRGIFGEAEAPENGDPEGEELRRRRLDFYLRNGFRYGGYDCALFGVHYQTLIRGREDVSPRELLEVHRSFYQRRIPPDRYRRFVQIPLAPGRRPRRLGEMEKDG